MLKKILVSCASLCAILNGFAQNSEPIKSSTTITGYVDGYFRALTKDGGGTHNNYTSLPIQTTHLIWEWPVLK